MSRSKLLDYNSIPIYYYSLKLLKQSNKESSLLFVQCFQFYVLITQQIKSESTSKLILLFSKWLKQKYKFAVAIARSQSDIAFEFTCHLALPD